MRVVLIYWAIAYEQQKEENQIEIGIVYVKLIMKW